MDTKWLEDFIALARIGNFSKAASQRFVTQPAFSRRIRSLEEWVGTPLFDRESNPVTLTKAGKELLPHALRIVAETASVKQDFRLLYGAGNSTIRIITSHRLSVHMVPKLAAGFLRANTDVRVSVMPIMDSTDKFGDCTDALVTGIADFLITYAHELLIFDEDLGGSLECREIDHDMIIPVTSPEYAKCIPVDWPHSETLPVDFVGYPEYSFTEKIIHPIVNQFESRLRTVYESPFTGSIRAMLLEGIGVTWLPLSVVAADLESGRLVRLPGDDLSVDLSVMIYRRRESTGNVMERFWRHIGTPLLSENKQADLPNQK